MSLIHDYLFPAMWLSYVTYWWAISPKVKATASVEPAASRLVRLVSLIGAVVLLSLPTRPFLFLGERFLPLGALYFWLGSAVTAAGLLFSVWARRHLGENWSQAVTLKEDHELITSGPYAIVRHPIYTGLLMGFVGSAVARGEWRGLLAIALVFNVLWLKLRLEEKWMRAQFGALYAAYSQRVKALVPYVI